VLSFLDGHVAWQPAQPPSVTAPTGRPAALASPDGAPCGARVYATGDGGSAGTRASSAAVQLSQ
jgi:hypothetical protein